MRIDSSVFSLSWIPSEAVVGLNKQVFESGIGHYDTPPPTTLSTHDDVLTLRDNDGFRFCNFLSAHIDVEDGVIVGADFDETSGTLMGSTTMRLGPARLTMLAPSKKQLRNIERHADHVRFEQTVGGRTALPAPRRVNKPPFVQFRAPLVWTTLALDVFADGTSTFELIGASPFPRHWIYDNTGSLSKKAGLADFKDWYRNAFGQHSPWGNEQFDVDVTDAESELEHALANQIMQSGKKPAIHTIDAGEDLITQGDTATDVYLLLDGTVTISVDGTPLAEFGPGVVLGERSLLEGGVRTATVTCNTKVRVAVAPEAVIDLTKLERLRELHQREAAE